MKNSKLWSVYLARCADGTLYCGIARDVTARIREHDAGKGARYTRGRGPLEVVATQRCRDHGLALRIEHLVKRLGRAEKLLLATDPKGLGRLARKARRARKAMVVLAVLAGGFTVGSPAHANSPVRLRVVTWNVWDVPAITTHLDERMAAIPDAVAALEPDLVFFQELWEDEHASSVTRRLSERGLGHSVRFESPEGRTGLVVVSKLPLGAGAFRPFAIGRMPHSFWHLDWLVSKGLASVVVETPLGALRLENTHLQAQYRADGYDAERLAQAAEIVVMNREQAREALVLAGDFNGAGDELPRRLLRDLGALDDASPRARQDSVYVRGSSAFTVRAVSAKPALGETVVLPGGARESLSDHAALVVELELAPCTECSPPRRVTTATRQAAARSLERAAEATPFRSALTLLTATALLVLAIGWKRKTRGFLVGSRRLVALRVLGLALLSSGFVWSFYLGAFYYPMRATLLRQVLDELSAVAPP